jgi:hypothetical protein
MGPWKTACTTFFFLRTEWMPQDVILTMPSLEPTGKPGTL